jgi:monoterpene epsilon-lactone hydrolase
MFRISAPASEAVSAEGILQESSQTQETAFEQVASAQDSANRQKGPRFVPARSIPVPSTVSPLRQNAIAAPYRVPAWNADPVDMAGWKALVSDLGAQTATATRELEKHFNVTREDVVINGVKAFLLTPPVVSPENRNRLLIHAHGGGYIYNPGEAGVMESVSMAAYAGIKVVSVDYRMPPDHPFPAGLDDCMKVWRATAETTDPKKLGLFGSSAGAGMALSMTSCGPKTKAYRYRLRSLSERHGRIWLRLATHLGRTSGWTMCS